MRSLLSLLLVCCAACLAAPARAQGRGGAAGLARLVEANVVATHAFQVLLAKGGGKGDAACYAAGGLSDEQLQSLVAHQRELLKGDVGEVRAWAQGRPSRFDPSKHLEPILSSGLAVPASAPVNVLGRYLRVNSKRGADAAGLRSVASLYQTILEVERDGDLLQEQFAFYRGLGLPVYVGQLGLAGDDAAMLRAGRELERGACASPFATDAAAWQLAGRKVWNWGEKHLGVRDARVLASELLRERDVRALVGRVRALPAQRIAVVGHSFTMGQHWSSPSSFVPVVAEIFRRENRRVEFRQFERGGLTASRARFLRLDRVHMNEPYHRLMAKQWLKVLAGVKGAGRGRG